MARNWQAQNDAESLLLLSDEHCKAVISEVRGYCNAFYAFPTLVMFHKPKEKERLSFIQTHGHFRPPDVVCLNREAMRPLFFLEVSGSTQYTLYPPEEEHHTKSRMLHVEADKVEDFREGYFGIPVLYSYVFADGHIRYAHWQDFHSERTETVISGGKEEVSRNYLLEPERMRPFFIHWGELMNMGVL